MYKHRKTYLFSLVAALLVALSINTFGVSFVLGPSSHASPSAKVTTSAHHRGSTHILAFHKVNMAKLPKAAPTKVQKPLRQMPIPVDPKKAAKFQNIALHNPHAPHSTLSLPAPTSKKGSKAKTPTATNSFSGQGDTCNCEPPDMGLAASDSFVLQGVNSSWAVYDTSGTLQPGFPKTAQDFFGIPNDCQGNPAFVSDPRAFYDPNDQRFWAAILQIEGSAVNSCPLISRYWIAVSQTSDPTGLWNVYAFDMTLGTSNVADYTQFGFDGQAVYWSANMYDITLSSFQYAEILEGNKAVMEAGGTFTPFFFSGLFVCSSVCITVDTVQPVLSEAKSYDPRAEFFVNTFNNGDGFGNGTSGDPFGNDCVSSACSTFMVWAFSNPIAHDSGGDPPRLTGALVNTNSYLFPPDPDQPGCTHCITPGKLDMRVSGTPVYHDGIISFAWETNANNGTQNVAAVEWSQTATALTNSDSSCVSSIDVCADIDPNSTFQSKGGYQVYNGDGASYYGTLMPDVGNNLFMVFEYSDASTNPEVAYVARRITFGDSLFSFHDSGLVLKSGEAAYTGSRWGDYDAASYTNTSSDLVWFAGEYSTGSGDWGTWIGNDQFSLFDA